MLPGEPTTRSNSFDRVIGAFEDAGSTVRRRGRQAKVSCPLHEDRDPSVSISWKYERGGITRVHCFSCNAGELALLEAVGLGLADRFDEPLPPREERPLGRRPRSMLSNPGPLPRRLTDDPPKPSVPAPRATSSRRMVCTYDYVDEAGALLYQNVRWEWSTVDGHAKTFKQRRPTADGEGWIEDAGALDGVRRVLRHLPDVVAAIAAGKEIWLAEGEKDDENLNAVLGDRGVATTNNNGSGSISDELIEQLRGAHVIAVIDRDPAGYERAHLVHTKVRSVAASVRIVLPAVLTPKADATDHLEAGHSLDDFVEFAAEDVATVHAARDLSKSADRAGTWIGRVQTADREARARLVAAVDAEGRSAVKAAEDEQRHARRWAIEAVRGARSAADEAALTYQVHNQIAALLTQHGQPAVAIPNIDHELARAEEAQRQCQHVATQAWEALGQSMPSDIARELGRLAPSAAAAAAARPLPEEPPQDSDDSDDAPMADVVPLRGGRGGGGDGDAHLRIRWTEFFRDHHGHLGMRRYGRDGQEISPAPILNLDAKVIRVECAEGDQLDLAEDASIALDDTDRSQFRIPEQTRVVAYILTYSHPETGEEMTLRVPADRARSCEWLADLPHMGLDYDSRVSGRSRVWDAIRKCSEGADVTVVYRTTGWRNLPNHGWTYIHAGGGITGQGNEPLCVQLSGMLSRVDLPAPVDDPRLLRRLFEEHSYALVNRLEPYMGAALLGATFRSVLGFTGPSLALFGVPGSYKSAASGLTMQHFGVRWERGLPSASMSGRGTTLNALRHALWEAKDCLFFGDDFAPDQGVDVAAKFLSEVARMHYNREERARGHINSSGEFETTGHGERSRTSMLLTSEIRAATVSGQERMLVLDLAKGQLDLTTIIDLDRYESRFGRASVMSSLLRWMASQDVAQLRSTYTGHAATVVEQRRADGTADREAEALGHLEAGWKLVLDFLVDIGAYQQQEADQLLITARANLDEAALRSKDLDAPTTLGERCRQLILSGLRTGAIHVTQVGGEPPGLPGALRLGYRRTVIGMDHHTHEELVKAEPRGEWVGVTYNSPEFGPRLHVDPTAMTRAILNIARQAQEPISATKLVLQRELAAVGLLRTAQETTPQGVVTRYTVGVTGISGRQERLWDLDAERLFDDDFQPPTPPLPTSPPEPPTPPETTREGTSEPAPIEPTEQDVDMPELTDQTHHTIGDPGPCPVCGQVCSLYLDGERIHLLCWKMRSPNMDQLDPVPAVEVQHETAPAPAAPRPTTQQRPVLASQRNWAYSAVVIDSSGVYLPDGTVGPPPQEFDLGSVAAIGEQYRIGHPASAGLVVLTSTLVEHLNLVPDMEAMSAPDEQGNAVPEWVVANRIKEFLAGKTAVLSNNSRGWTIDGGDLAPWTRIRRGDRTFRLVLEPYVWIWDQRADSGSPFLHLPDESDPVICWGELARRLERLSELLDIPFSTSPGVTGEALFDQIQRRRGRKSGRVLTSAGRAPSAVLEEQHELEREVSWSRKPAKTELTAAAALHGYDRRGSYLSSLGTIDLGVGEPAQVDAAEARIVLEKARQERTKVPFALWRVDLPAWDQAVPPPHPDQTRTAAVTRWVTTQTLTLLLDDEDRGGAAYSVADLNVSGAWVWPEQARLLEPWYKRVREALLKAREDGDDPVDRAVKGIYTGYVGRMAASYTLNGTRPWHHQPVWRAAIQGSARASLWRAVKKHQLETGRIPVAIDHDEVIYLDQNSDPKTTPPAADNGRLGALKPSKTLPLTDPVRRRLLEGARASDPTLWSEDR